MPLLAYATMALVTDYDCWHLDHGSVDVSTVITTLTANAGHGRALVAQLPDIVGQNRDSCPHKCDRALDFALMTTPEKRDPDLISKLDAVAGR